MSRALAEAVGATVLLNDVAERSLTSSTGAKAVGATVLLNGVAERSRT